MRYGLVASLKILIVLMEMSIWICKLLRWYACLLFCHRQLGNERSRFLKPNPDLKGTSVHTNAVISWVINIFCWSDLRVPSIFRCNTSFRSWYCSIQRIWPKHSIAFPISNRRVCHQSSPDFGAPWGVLREAKWTHSSRSKNTIFMKNKVRSEFFS